MVHLLIAVMKVMKQLMDERIFAMLGGGGHARVLIDALSGSGVNVDVILDPGISIGQKILEIPVVGDESWILNVPNSNLFFINGIGSKPKSNLRQSIFERIKRLNFNFMSVTHPAAVVGLNVELLEGSQVMAGAIIQCASKLGINSIVNTGAKVDHDCTIGSHAFIGPGAILCGSVSIGSGVYVGAGAVILPGIKIGDGAVIGAGSVVISDVNHGDQVVGAPAISKENL